MNSNSVGFFKKLLLSIVEHRIFPYIVKEKIWSAIGYYLKLILLVSMILAFAATSKIFEMLPEYVDKIDEKMPDFLIKDGVLAVQSGDSFELNKNLYVDLTNAQNEKQIEAKEIIDSIEKEYNIYVVVGKKSADFYRKDEEDNAESIMSISFSEVIGANKKSILDEWRISLDSFAVKLIIYISLIGIFFIIYGLYRSWILITYVISVFFLNVVFVNKLRIRDYFKIAIYVSTLPVLLETVSFIIAKSLPDAASFIEMLIAIIYIFYALRAIKLDSILVNAIGNTPEEKIRNAITHAQEELQKQIDEIEEKKKQSEEAEEKLKEFNNEVNDDNETKEQNNDINIEDNKDDDTKNS